jgi:hypothetical protein
MELEGRLGLGDGALDLKLCDYENILLPHQSLFRDESPKDEDLSFFASNSSSNFDPTLSSTIESLFQKICDSSLENKSIFETLNAHNPSHVSISKLSEIQREIDDIVFTTILNLQTSQRLRLYASLLQLVRDRISKSKT